MDPEKFAALTHIHISQICERGHSTPQRHPIERIDDTRPVQVANLKSAEIILTCPECGGKIVRVETWTPDGAEMLGEFEVRWNDPQPGG